MGDLNSVLLEGRVVNGPAWTGDTNPVRAWFDLDNTAAKGIGGMFHVEVVGSLAIHCVDRIEQGKRVSIVGKLTRTAECVPYILAEHVQIPAPARFTPQPEPAEVEA